MNIAEHLASYALSFMKEDLPEQAQQAAKEHILDTFGCILSGMTDPFIKTMRDYAIDFGGKPTSTILGVPGLCTDAATAAMVNSMSGHLRDYDDMSSAMNGHPSVIALPVALAVAEETGSSGDTILRAYIAGVEVMAAMGRSLNTPLEEKEFNATSVLGVFGAATTTGCLLNLSEKQMANALAIAFGEASGTKANFGTSAKDITIGHTCAKGIFAAQMAKRGIGANTKILNEPGGPFCGLKATDYTDTLYAIKNRTLDFLNPGIVVKPYPSCRGNHAAIDIMYDFLAEGLATDCIEKIICTGQPSVISTDRYPIPKTPAEGKFSIPFCTALLLKNKRIVLEDFIGEHIACYEELLPLMQLVSIEKDDTFGSEARFGLSLEVQMNNGESLYKRKCYAKGDSRSPLTRAELHMKFAECAGYLLSKDRIEEIYELIMNLEKQNLPDIKKLLFT